VGERRRKSFGGLASLKRSIETSGLLHPIVLRNGHQLVAGARRLESCRQLGWATIPARRVESMTDDELRTIEIEENEQRLALADYDSSRQRLAEIRQAEADARAETIGGAPTVSGKRGPKRKPGSKKDIARRTGVSPKGQKRVADHVAIAEAFPFMQKPGWKQYTVLEAGERLAELPKKEHALIAILLDQPYVQPKAAIKILSTLVKLEAAARSEIYDLAKSPDSEDRSLALTKAAELPKEPHACLLCLIEARRHLAKCRKGHDAILKSVDSFIETLRKESEDGE
jgi:hypothetical protein